MSTEETRCIESESEMLEKNGEFPRTGSVRNDGNGYIKAVVRLITTRYSIQQYTL